MLDSARHTHTVRLLESLFTTWSRRVHSLHSESQRYIRIRQRSAHKHNRKSLELFEEAIAKNWNHQSTLWLLFCRVLRTPKISGRKEWQIRCIFAGDCSSLQMQPRWGTNFLCRRECHSCAGHSSQRGCLHATIRYRILFIGQLRWRNVRIKVYYISNTQIPYKTKTGTNPNPNPIPNLKKTKTGTNPNWLWFRNRDPRLQRAAASASYILALGSGQRLLCPSIRARRAPRVS